VAKIICHTITGCAKSGHIYRHPNQNHSEFTTSMENVLGKISSQDLPCIIAGDLNIDLSKCDSNKSTAEYVDNLLTNNFMPVILMPTRITSHSVSLIDHIFYFESPKNKHTLRVKSGNLLEDISDHLPNYVLLFNDKQQNNASRPMVRIFSEKNLTNFRSELQNADWGVVYENNDVNSAYNNFLNILLMHLKNLFLLLNYP